LISSVADEFVEHEDLPNTTNPDDWAKISGRKGERIVYIRTITTHGDGGDELVGGKEIERAATGQYL
jgi:proteasome-associated ATPase